MSSILFRKTVNALSQSEPRQAELRPLGSVALPRQAEPRPLGRAYGLSAKDVGFDFAKVMERSRAVAGQMAKGVEFLFRKNKVEYFVGAPYARPTRSCRHRKYFSNLRDRFSVLQLISQNPQHEG